MPSVRPAYTRFISICSMAARAFLYISGNAMTVAAITQPSHVCTTLKSNCSNRNSPSGRLLLKRRSRKKPATVGGSTMGRVRMPSMTAFFPGVVFTTFLAANIPRKNEINVATTPVFSDIKSGLQSRSFNICMISSITSPFIRSYQNSMNQIQLSPHPKG